MPDQGPRPSPVPKLTRRPAPPRPFPGPPARQPARHELRREAAGSDRIAAAGGQRGLPSPAPSAPDLPRVPTARLGAGGAAPARSALVLAAWAEGVGAGRPAARPPPPGPGGTPRSPIYPSSSSSSSSSISSRTSLVIMGMSPPAAGNLAQSWGLSESGTSALTGRAPGQGRQDASHSRRGGRGAQPALGEAGPEWRAQDNLWPPEPGRAGPLSMPSERRGACGMIELPRLRSSRRKSGGGRGELGLARCPPVSSPKGEARA